MAGHRDLQRKQIAALEAVVRSELASMRKKYASTLIVVLSSLAEGADRLVARVALGLGLSLVVAMPLPQEEFEQDFATSESLQEFRELLARADRAFFVPPADREDPEQATRRDFAYARCAAYVVSHCVELIALWDGRSDGATGGTAESVAFQLEGIPAPYVPESLALDPALTGPVLHVATQRASQRNPDSKTDSGETVEARWLYPPAIPEANPAEAFEKLARDLDDFNRDALRLGFAGGDFEVAVLRDRADAVARFYERRATRALTLIFVFVFLATAGFNVYSFLPQHPLALLLAFLTLTGAAVLVYAISRRHAWKDRYQDARALAEALRVAEYWQLAGIGESVANRFADAQEGQIDWLPHAVRALAEPLGVFAEPDVDVRANAPRVYDEWIVGQIEYFTNFAGRREHAHKQVFNRAATVGLVCSIALSIATLPLAKAVSGTLNGIFSMIATIIALSAGLLHSYADKRGWSELARRYDRMALVFSRAREQLSRLDLSDSLPEMQRVLLQLGEEAIRESVSWLTLQRTRPITVPRA